MACQNVERGERRSLQQSTGEDLRHSIHRGLHPRYGRTPPWIQCLDSADDYTDNDDSTGVSRASSVSMRDRINGAKKAKKRRDSDTFDTRSNYVAYAPAYGHPHQATWAQPHYMPAGAQLNGAVQQQSFPPAVPNMYGVPNQQFPPMVPGNGYGPPYNNMSNVSHGVHLWIALYGTTDILTTIFTVRPASWPAALPTSGEPDASRTIRTTHAGSTSTSERVAATSELQLEPLPISGHASSSKWDPLRLWCPPSQRQP